MLRPERGRTQNLKQGKVGDMEQQDGSRKPEAAFEQCQLFSDACPPGLILRSYPEQVERVQPSQQFKGAKGRQKMTPTTVGASATRIIATPALPGGGGDAFKAGRFGCASSRVGSTQPPITAPTTRSKPVAGRVGDGAFSAYTRRSCAKSS